MKILIVEDDVHTRNGLKEILETEGYDVSVASDGQEGLDMVSSVQPDFICLDIMMPQLNGYDVCRKIRKKDESIPIIFISAKSEEIDKVLGLELGADDFIMKPFGVKEVVARIRAVTRRCLERQVDVASDQSYSFGDLKVFPAKLKAQRHDQTIELSIRDIKIIQFFKDNANEPLARSQLFEHCWEIDYYSDSRTLDQYISQLRKRIERDPKHPVLITTVHGFGYRFSNLNNS